MSLALRARPRMTGVAMGVVADDEPRRLQRGGELGANTVGDAHALEAEERRWPCQAAARSQGFGRGDIAGDASGASLTCGKPRLLRSACQRWGLTPYFLPATSQHRIQW